MPLHTVLFPVDREHATDFWLDEIEKLLTNVYIDIYVVAR
jgi:hypothetical protein